MTKVVQLSNHFVETKKREKSMKEEREDYNERYALSSSVHSFFLIPILCELQEVEPKGGNK